MLLRFCCPILAVFLLTGASSEARRASRGSSGGLAQERGLSQAETRAAGVVLQEAAHGSAGAIEDDTAARRLSPDYYRVYRRGPTVVTVKKVAAPPPPEPPVAAVVKPPPLAPKVKLAPVAKPSRIVRAPVVTPVAKRVAVAPPLLPKPAPKPLPRQPLPPPSPAALPSQRPVLRVAVMPTDSSGTIYLPVRGKRAVAPAPAAPIAKAAAPRIKPKRQLFR